MEPLAKRLNIEIELDRKLTERILSSENLPDWLEKLKTTFANMELKFEGGESSQAATERIVEVVEGILSSEKKLPSLLHMAILFPYY
ncbi:hypothetical protein [Bacillus sp. JJ1474]|uniref:hypothetical protein n=1 Tax=Bacillus sp. JJ1474 TaxID=3122955 RepID=UPI002FFDF3EB